jgi:hypothetical protein
MTLPADGADADLARFRFNVLGPFKARYDRRQVHVTGVARTVLAVLTASPGHVVSVGRIVADSEQTRKGYRHDLQLWLVHPDSTDLLPHHRPDRRGDEPGARRGWRRREAIIRCGG